MLSKDGENDPANRVEMIKDIANSIAQIPDDISRSEYIKACSRMLKVKEVDLSKEVTIQKQKIRSPLRSNINIDKVIDEQKIDKRKKNKEEKEIVRLLLNYGNEKLKINKQSISISDFIIKELKADNITFEREDYQLLLNEIEQHLVKNREIKLNYFTLHFNPSISR